MTCLMLRLCHAIELNRIELNRKTRSASTEIDSINTNRTTEYRFNCYCRCLARLAGRWLDAQCLIGMRLVGWLVSCSRREEQLARLKKRSACAKNRSVCRRGDAILSTELLEFELLFDLSGRLQVESLFSLRTTSAQTLSTLLLSKSVRCSSNTQNRVLIRSYSRSNRDFSDAQSPELQLDSLPAESQASRLTSAHIDTHTASTEA